MFSSVQKLTFILLNLQSEVTNYTFHLYATVFCDEHYESVFFNLQALWFKISWYTLLMKVKDLLQYMFYPQKNSWQLRFNSFSNIHWLLAKHLEIDNISYWNQKVCVVVLYLPHGYCATLIKYVTLLGPSCLTWKAFSVMFTVPD